MIINWKMKSGDFLDIVEIYNFNLDHFMIIDNTDDKIMIIDNTDDKIFEKYLIKLSTSYNEKDYEFISNIKDGFIPFKLRNFIFTLKFLDEETAFYFKLKYSQLI